MTGKHALLLGGAIAVGLYVMHHHGKSAAVDSLPLLPADQAHAPHAMAHDSCSQWGCDGVTKHDDAAAAFYPGAEAPW